MAADDEQRFDLREIADDRRDVVATSVRDRMVDDDDERWLLCGRSDATGVVLFQLRLRHVARIFHV